MGGSNLQGASVVTIGGVNMLYTLLVSVQEKHCGATGPDHETDEHGIRDGVQDDDAGAGTQLNRTKSLRHQYHFPCPVDHLVSWECRPSLRP